MKIMKFYCFRHIVVTTSKGQFVFTVRSHQDVIPSTIGFSRFQRKWATLSIGQDIDVRAYQFDKKFEQTLAKIILEVNFYQMKR
jgi:vesicle-fusing ATPase